jgi:hypothetical protein
LKEEIMATKSYGIAFLTASLALGVLVGVAAVLLFTPHVSSTNWGVYVGPLPSQLSFDPVRMDKADTVRWLSTLTAKRLYIETEQKIFANSVLQQDTRRYRVTCSGSGCDSGPVVSAPYPPMPTGGYKYWQGLADPSGPIVWADGRIINQW